MLAAPALMMKPGHLESKAKVAAPLPPSPPREPGIPSPSPGQVIPERDRSHEQFYYETPQGHQNFRAGGEDRGEGQPQTESKGDGAVGPGGFSGSTGDGRGYGCCLSLGASIRAWRKVPKHARNLGGKGTPQDGEGLGTEAGVGPWVGVLARVPW